MTWTDLVGRTPVANGSASTHELLLAMFGAYLRPREALMWSGGLLQALGVCGVGPSAGRVAMARLVTRGLAYRSRSGRYVAFGLTDYGHHLVEDADNRVENLVRSGSGQGEDSWTVVWHTLPESQKEERSHFLRQLRFHGFGQLQDGVWIAPHDFVSPVVDLVAKMEISDKVVVFGTHDLQGALGPLTQQVWDLDALSSAYEAFAEEFREAQPDGGDDRDVFRFCTRLIVGYRAFAEADPGLPVALTPYLPERDRATAIYKLRLQEHQDQASDYFVGLTSTVSRGSGPAMR